MDLTFCCLLLTLLVLLSKIFKKYVLFNLRDLKVKRNVQIKKREKNLLKLNYGGNSLNLISNPINSLTAKVKVIFIVIHIFVCLFIHCNCW